MMVTEEGDAVAASPGSARGRRCQRSRSRTNTLLPTRSTRQQAMGSRAGARNAAPVRRLKQAWCRGHRMVSADDQPGGQGAMIVGAFRAQREKFRAAPDEDCRVRIDAP